MAKIFGVWFIVLATTTAFLLQSPVVRLERLSALPLTEENVVSTLETARTELQQLFGYSDENRNVGITGKVDFVEVDGPTVVLRLSGRFWHERRTVLGRVGNFLREAIPEISDVTISAEIKNFYPSLDFIFLF